MAEQQKSEEKKRYSFPHKAVWIINIFAVGALLLSYISMYIPPDKVWWLALFGIGYGTLLIFNLIFVLIWLWKKSRKFMVSLFLCLAGISNVFNIVELPLFRSKAPDPGKYVSPIKVMSFNVRLFDLYNWFHNYETRDDIFRFLSKESPDIVCFQEFYTSESGKFNFNNKDTLIRVLQAPYFHTAYSVTLREKDHWGIATYSKFPIVKQEAVHFNKNSGNIFIYSDIIKDEDTIRVFNVHLESIRFRKEDYKFIENLGNDEVEQDEVAGGLKILRRMKRAYQKRSHQVDIIVDQIRKSPYPVIICGDFNDTPTSYAVRKIAGNMKDAFRESGVGFGKTYAGPFPSFRIDYIFHAKEFKSFGYTTHHEKISDHYPISCYLTWKKRGL
jgi:endonuclease/exonuclease/phosphatase family metal-dependent hydrolase